ncbi:MAG: TIGR01440 family protein [Oscillospiraceae bacterium]|jgi:uncharacterized protein (TIGR01440 family)|nr:TIGR01440 family protein [Oscillospiraceae bacterium]
MSVLGQSSDLTDSFITGCAGALSRAVAELADRAVYDPIRLLVIGCSTSETAGSRIGTRAYTALGGAMADAALRACRERGIMLAAQCCEHLNRALVVERAALDEYRLRRVIAKPTPEAGGSFAAAVFERMDAPVLAEAIESDAGLDIGGTLIGMHLKRVAVPVRLEVCVIGAAHVNAAVTRAAYTGGPRASYPQT